MPFLSSGFRTSKPLTSFLSIHTVLNQGLSFKRKINKLYLTKGEDRTEEQHRYSDEMTNFNHDKACELRPAQKFGELVSSVADPYISVVKGPCNRKHVTK